MIDAKKTFEKFGYHISDLGPHSTRRVFAICEKCGKIRTVQFASYRDLCLKCAHNDPNVIAKKNTPEARRKNSISSTGKKHTEETIKKCRQAKLGAKNPMNRLDVRKTHKRACNTQAFVDAHSGENHYNYEQILKITKFVKENTNKHLCLCGCGGYIKIERYHYTVGIPKYIYNHHNKGENNWNWKGGISFEPYCHKFNNALKQKIRDKYNNCDFISGLPDYICNHQRKLDVHHVDYDKMQGCNGHEWHLIPLSRRHNSIVNRNRSFWHRLFTYTLMYDKTYYKETDKDFNISGVLL